VNTEAGDVRDALRGYQARAEQQALASRPQAVASEEAPPSAVAAGQREAETVSRAPVPWAQQQVPWASQQAFPQAWPPASPPASQQASQQAAPSSLQGLLQAPA
jgi:hypothetical protein